MGRNSAASELNTRSAATPQPSQQTSDDVDIEAADAALAAREAELEVTKTCVAAYPLACAS